MAEMAVSAIAAEKSKTGFTKIPRFIATTIPATNGSSRRNNGKAFQNFMLKRELTIS